VTDPDRGTGATRVTGGVLDDAAALGRIDRSGMLGNVTGIPGQVRDAWARTRKLELSDAYRSANAVAVLGMGGSAIGADLVRGIWADRLTVPVEVVRGYDLPAWVGPGTLVVASSYSGATEETISALEAALRRGAPVAAISTGGPILEVATRARLPVLTFSGGGQPRAAIGYAVALLAGLLERAGVLALGEPEVMRAAAAAERAIEEFGPAVPTERNEAKQIAWTMVDQLPVIEAAGFLAPVARRWKTQLNENGKSFANWEELPEATHNAVVGYQHPESLRDHLQMVFLSSSLDHERNSLRAEVSEGLLDRVHIGRRSVRAEGGSRFDQALRMIVLGDFVSVYLAALYGVDPTPVEAIDQVKSRLAAGHDKADEES
jgi:glucose/mannose-6-phosphate isomerase